MLFDTLNFGCGQVKSLGRYQMSGGVGASGGADAAQLDTTACSSLGTKYTCDVSQGAGVGIFVLYSVTNVDLRNTLYIYSNIGST